MVCQSPAHFSQLVVCPSNVQAKRCIILMQGNPKAGLSFYASLRQCVAAGPLCKFIGVLYKLLCKCVDERRRPTARPPPLPRISPRGRGPEMKKKSPKRVRIPSID